MNTKLLYFSIFSGDIYEIMPEDEKALDSFQIPLKMRPKGCRKCKGCFYIHYDLTNKKFDICPRCAKKYIDYNKLLNEKP
jgi:predicted Zn-ribbon and HTH transcriptional regulator